MTTSFKSGLLSALPAILAAAGLSESLPSARGENLSLRLAVEVTRHGERAPHYIYDFTADPADNFQVAYNLTETGAQSHYANGQGIREKLIDKDFLSAEYDASEVYVQSTFRDRTIDSARAQLDGLYDKPLAWPEVDPQFQINIVPDEQDLILHLSDDNCERFAEILDAVKTDSDTQKMLASVDVDLEATLFPQLR